MWNFDRLLSGVETIFSKRKKESFNLTLLNDNNKSIHSVLNGSNISNILSTNEKVLKLAKEEYIQLNQELNYRSPFSPKNSPATICGHGTNAYSLWTSI